MCYTLLNQEYQMQARVAQHGGGAPFVQMQPSSVIQVAFGAVGESSTSVWLDFCEMIWHLPQESQKPRRWTTTEPSDVAAWLYGNGSGQRGQNKALHYSGCADCSSDSFVP